MRMRNLAITTGLFIGLCTLVYVGARFVIAAASPRPSNLGLVDRQLRPCPDTPNCVTSRPTDPGQAINPLVFTSPGAEAHTRLENILRTIPRLTIVENRPDYIHAETRSLVWGFVDDNEFYFDETTGIIEIRAAARLGSDDLGKNRERIEMIRTKFETD
jgi:uncharacterized protein (DUF1499 family)